ncbi:uncharacterized protein MKZ38_000340 [Zalerion maritima]|uniref:RRN7-type domain-containing protein n=1 Tax=Zalerion maritima TaxID=339359 RepID=A0AAD5WS36_9PEZI|nr:uncharacterized protein MKZ38_000340 [Zalerion maritima]
MEAETLRLRKFPAGERCEECGARKWYQESGHRYCQRGHRLEGFIEVALENEDGFGEITTKSQRSIAPKEEKKRQKRKGNRLTGRRARELYLECFQLVLRKQVSTLRKFHEAEFPSQKLETTVKDLWELRVRSFPGLSTVDGEREENNEDPVSSADEGTLFSSLAPEGDEDVIGNGKKKETVVDWEASPWQLPTLTDSLGIIYLACVMLRLPVRIGQLYKLAKTNQIPYSAVASQLPVKMMEAIPRTYEQVFNQTSDSWKGDEIHIAIKRLLQGYKKHYGLIFPEPNWPFILLAYIQRLALPIEIYLISKRIVQNILGISFVLTTDTRTKPYAPNPDATMTASIAVATKLLYPFEDTENEQLLHQPNFFTSWRFDWEKWEQLSRSMEGNTPDPRTEQDVYNMSEEDLDKYVATLTASSPGNRDPPDELMALFPVSQMDDETINNLSGGGGVGVMDVDGLVVQFEDFLRISLTEPKEGQHQLYQRLKDPRHLKGMSRTFHERACELSGLRMETLIKAVLAIERKLDRWADDRNREEREEGGA